MYRRVLLGLLVSLSASFAQAAGGQEWSIKSVAGAVEVSTGDGWKSVAAGGALQDGDSLRTKSDGEAQLRLGRLWIHLAPRSQVEIHADAAGKSLTVNEVAGSVGFDVSSDEGRFLLRTPLASVAVKKAVFGVVADATQSTISVQSGAVRAEDAGGLSRTDIQAGETARAQRGSRLTKRPLNAKDSATAASTPAGAALRAAAAAAETAPLSASAAGDAAPDANGGKPGESASPLRGALPLNADANASTKDIVPLSELAKQLPGKAPLDAPTPANAASASALVAKTIAGASASGHAHVDAAGLAAIGVGATGGKVKIDAGAASAVLSAVGSGAVQQLAAPESDPSPASESDPAPDGGPGKSKPGAEARKDRPAPPDELTPADPKKKKKKKDPQAEDKREPVAEAQPEPEPEPTLTRTQAVFSGPILPELLDLDDTGQFIGGLAAVVLTLVFGAILNLIMGEAGFGLLGNGVLLLLGTIVGTEFRDVLFSGDGWVNYDPYLSLAVILSFAIGSAFGAAYLRYRLLLDEEPAQRPSSIPAGRLAKARIG